MSTYVIGDIHGCLTALETLLHLIDPTPEDTIITLGDYIDRGPDSKGVIDLLIEFSKTRNLITLKGNHEQMLEHASLDTLSLMNWATNGGIETLDSFPDCDYIDQIPEPYWDFITNCKLYHETETHILVHAGLDPKLPLEEQTEEDLLWLRFDNLKPHQSEKTIICGHTPDRKEFKPRTKKGAICIDTYVYHTGYLTCLELETGTYHQANQKAQTKTGSIAVK